MNEADELTEEAHFRKHIFYVVLDNVIRELSICFSEPKQIFDTFSAFFGTTKKISKEELKCKAAKLAEKYSKDINNKENLVQEMNHITMGSQCQFWKKTVGCIGTVKCFGRVQIR